MTIYYCVCNACTKKQYQICPTKQKLLIENLEKEIEEKQNLLKSMKKIENNDDIIKKGIIFEYAS